MRLNWHAGRSTLQNEIVGNLEKELGSLPHDVEDMKLDDLCSYLQISFTGELGRHSQSMINRMISSKMPGTFTVRSVRKELERKWGFASDRQDSILLLATTIQPAARLSSELEGHRFLDNAVSNYMENVGIDPLSITAGSGKQDSVTLDPAVLDHLREEQGTLNRKLMNAYANHIRTDSKDIGAVADALKESIQTLQSQLGSWVEEHGEMYGDGIESMFDAKKARSYDSSWNWGMQALLVSYYDIVKGALRDNKELAQRVHRIQNQCNGRLVQAMRHLQEKALRISLSQHSRTENYQTASRFLGYLIEICVKDLLLPPVTREIPNITAPKTLVDSRGNIQYFEVSRPIKRDRSSHDCISAKEVCLPEDSVDGKLQQVPECRPSSYSHIRIQTKGKGGWATNNDLTHKYWESLDLNITQGITFQEKCILITGASKGSIGLDILKRVLSGGAKVVVTTRSYSAAAARFYQQLYVEFGARGSCLVVVPFNQGSQRDVKSLISYIYDASGLGWDLDYLVPFAAISENGRDISNIDSISELAHRVMLTNTVRLLGEIRTQKIARGIITRPVHVILPLSPNHGIFGSDGLYAESKLALRSLLNKWRSEDWCNYISICGASIGWTRGTGLMAPNDIVAEGIEKLGVRTFSQNEMAANILGLMSPMMTSICQVGPIIADLTGGMDKVDDFDIAVSRVREDLHATAEIRRAILQDNDMDSRTINGSDTRLTDECLSTLIDHRVNMSLEFPKLIDYETEIAPLHDELAGMVDLERVIVVTGFSEIGPYGNSRTRWDMEAEGELSFEGCIEMAWMMGLIKHHNGPVAGQGHYVGWVDAKTGKAVADKDIKDQYQAHILRHTGVREVETNSEGSSATNKKPYLHELMINEDLEPFEASRELAMHFTAHHGDKVEITEIEGSDHFHVRIKKGATLLIPKTADIGPRVAGQIPTGWDARVYGISDEIISQVDRLTLYSLVCAVEALLCAGVTDPYEFYQHIHTSDVGICIGSSIGGVSSLNDMFKHRLIDKAVQRDALQETYINTTSAWVNMLLLSSNGPIRTPVGACATALEALDTGYELIVSGKAKMCLVGGLDDLQDDMSFEFAKMKATIDPETDFRRGREATEMSRPATSSRDGFVEAQGCGLQVLTSAKLAIDMGLPIYGVIALTQTASDKIGRSIPAPGQGLLSVVREESSVLPSPLLDVRYRRQLLEHRLEQIARDDEFKLALLQRQLAKGSFEIPSEVAMEFSRERISSIQAEAKVQRQEALYTYGNHFWKGDHRISPLRGALATWGLTVDDLDIASFHGTSTTVGDKNELKVIQQQLSHLGRTKGSPVIGIFQKYLTGHAKGAAGAWMLNGCLQVVNHGLVPGNRNADNIDEGFEAFDHITFPNRSIQTDGVKAFSITSFGFGQKGAQAIGVHPKYLFATLDEDTYREYQKRVADRENRARAYFQSAMVSNRLFVAKDRPPYQEDSEVNFLLNPKARIA